jgi:curved DNA-binding protein CbpA
MTIKFFTPLPTTAEELKKLYRTLAMLHHPDRPNGNEEAFKVINNEFEYLFGKLKDTHTNAKGETYTSNRPTTETPAEFMDIISKLVNLNLTIEIVGTFVWVSGDTKPHRELLKSLNFKFSSNKLAWYLPPKGYRKYNNKQYTLDEIKRMFGSQTVKAGSHGDDDGKPSQRIA